MSAGGPLEGKIAVVTGSSRGIGRAIALCLARAGATLVVNSSREGGASQVLSELQALGRPVIAVAADVSVRQQADRLGDRALEAFGRVDLLINNAGVVFRGALAQTPDEQLTRVLGVNLAGPFYLCRRLLPQMLARGEGRIVNVSSISGTLGTPGLSAYCASKWGLNGLTKALAAEVDGKGVLVCGVLPGSVDTQMLVGSEFTPDIAPEEIAGVVRYLCAEAPLAMNGSLVEAFG